MILRTLSDVRRRGSDDDPLASQAAPHGRNHPVQGEAYGRAGRRSGTNRGQRIGTGSNWRQTSRLEDSAAPLVQADFRKSSARLS